MTTKPKKIPKHLKSNHGLLNIFNKFRIFSLSLAESLDAWRIIPRILLIAYSVLIVNMYVWYRSIPTYVQEKCDAAVIQILIQNHASIDDAQKAACSVQNVVGGPTTSQTALVTTIIGLSSLIFGFYTNSGRKWENGMPNDLITPRPPHHAYYDDNDLNMLEGKAPLPPPPEGRPLPPK